MEGGAALAVVGALCRLAWPRFEPSTEQRALGEGRGGVSAELEGRCRQGRDGGGQGAEGVASTTALLRRTGARTPTCWFSDATNQRMPATEQDGKQTKHGSEPSALSSWGDGGQGTPPTVERATGNVGVSVMGLIWGRCWADQPRAPWFLTSSSRSASSSPNRSTTHAATSEGEAAGAMAAMARSISSAVSKRSAGFRAQSLHHNGAPADPCDLSTELGGGGLLKTRLVQWSSPWSPSFNRRPREAFPQDDTSGVQIGPAGRTFSPRSCSGAMYAILPLNPSSVVGLQPSRAPLRCRSP